MPGRGRSGRPTTPSWAGPGQTGRADCNIDDAVDRAAPPVQRAVLRVVQEALTNVHRHAHATRVYVTVQVDGQNLKLRIVDDGQGLPMIKDDILPELGVGIPGIRSRIQQFGGDVSLTSSRRGTMVRASIPLHPTIAKDGAISFPEDNLRVSANDTAGPSR